MGASCKVPNPRLQPTGRFCHPPCNSNQGARSAPTAEPLLVGQQGGIVTVGRTVSVAFALLCHCSLALADSIVHDVTPENLHDQRLAISVDYLIVGDRFDFDVSAVVDEDPEEYDPWLATLALPGRAVAWMPGQRVDSTKTWHFSLFARQLESAEFSIAWWAYRMPSFTAWRLYPVDFVAPADIPAKRVDWVTPSLFAGCLAASLIGGALVFTAIRGARTNRRRPVPDSAQPALAADGALLSPSPREQPGRQKRPDG